MAGQANGIILVTGPTGSGKTSTLYTTLKHLATREVNLCTVEDPIEMVEPAFNQMQVQHNIDLTFASGVRALLRQDPDIIMIGEIRDQETAEMAIQAALTGHLVLSTLHTNDAPSAISRLQELGIAHYLIKATLIGVMAQRLVRLLCPHCKRGVTGHGNTHEAVGCADCRDSGYRGRAGLYEIMPLPLAQALIYPGLGGPADLPSRRDCADAPLLSTADTDDYLALYLSDGGKSSAYAMPLLAQTFSGLPKAFIAVAQYDPLRDDGRLYAERLQAAGVDTRLYPGKGLVHGCLRGRRQVAEVDQLYDDLLHYLRSEGLTQV